MRSLRRAGVAVATPIIGRFRRAPVYPLYYVEDRELFESASVHRTSAGEDRRAICRKPTSATVPHGSRRRAAFRLSRRIASDAALIDRRKASDSEFSRPHPGRFGPSSKTCPRCPPQRRRTGSRRAHAVAAAACMATLSAAID